MDVLSIIKLVITLGTASGLFAGLIRYFRPAQRAQRALMFSQIARDVVALIVHQKGMSASAEQIFDEAVSAVLAMLLNNGVKQDTAGDMARRLVAGAISSLGVKGLASKAANGSK